MIRTVVNQDQYLKNFGFALKDADTSLTSTKYRSDILTLPYYNHKMKAHAIGAIGKCHRLPAWGNFDGYDVPYVSIVLNCNGCKYGGIY